MTGGRASRDKGARWEREVVAWFRAHGWPHAERRIMGMADDRGDLTGVGPVVVECKDQQTLTLGSWVDQLAIEMIEADAETGVVIAKRRGETNVGLAFAVMPVAVWARLAKAAGL